MKKIFTVLLVSLCFTITYGQKGNLEIDKMYFLVGTLGEYMGREKYKDVENRVDEYYKGEKTLINFIISNFMDTHTDLRLDSAKHVGRGQYELFSPSLVKRIDEYYTYKPSSRGIKKANQPSLEKLNLDSLVKTKDFRSKYFDTVYTGSVRRDIFKSDVQKLSFITGIYTRYHDSRDKKYCIKIFNSASKAKVCAELLKEIKCKDVKYEILQNIPVCHQIYFTPTEELIKYLNEYAYLR